MIEYNKITYSAVNYITFNNIEIVVRGLFNKQEADTIRKQLKEKYGT